MSEIYVAMCAEQHSGDDPAWIVGAYSTAQRAMDACQADAEYSQDCKLPPIQWQISDLGSAFWTDAQPYGYRIHRAVLDSDVSAWRDVRLNG